MADIDPVIVPAFVTHYHPAGDAPFRNLGDLPVEEARAVVEKLGERRKADPRHKRLFGRHYVDYRRQVEDKLRALFRARGGRPERVAPHYFVLGESAWFQGAYPETKEVRLPLDELPRDQTTFTYPDSGVAMRVGPDFGLPADPMRPYHERVYVLDELSDVIATYGLPTDSPGQRYEDYHLRPFERYVEIQLWSDTPVRRFVNP